MENETEGCTGSRAGNITVCLCFGGFLSEQWFGVLQVNCISLHVTVPKQTPGEEHYKKVRVIFVKSKVVRIGSKRTGLAS